MIEKRYSIRMSASQEGRHVSGAERIVGHGEISSVTSRLVARAMEKGATPDMIIVKIEDLGNSPLRQLRALDVMTVSAPDSATGRSSASRILQQAGVGETAALAAIRFLSAGAAPSGGNMRGAIIMDSRNGERLEPDRERGVRASRFDWAEETLEKMRRILADLGLTHYRTLEALALATKIAHAPGVLAELCWSDEPDYTAGYVASIRIGYVRFPFLKKKGDPIGGRVFFIDRSNLDLEGFINYLQKEPVVIAEIGVCRAQLTPEEYFSSGGQDIRILPS